jgi:two-component system response regulator AtoC
MLLRALLVTDSSALQRRVERLLGTADVLVETAAGVWQGLARESFDVLIIPRSELPEPAAEVVSTIRRVPDRPDVIVLQNEEDPKVRAALLSAGCLAVLNLGLGDHLLGAALTAVIARRREALLGQMAEPPAARPPRLADLSSASPVMQELLDVAWRVARADSSLLILGETGVGKEWLARAIHAEGPRAEGPFVAVNCAAVPESLLESELFGHEKGAFTGSVKARRGYFELAHGGTLFLDEIADLPVHVQAKLLRVLQEHRIQRLGAERPVEVNVRVMAATNRDLPKALAEQSLREDLYYRLSVVTLEVPPLRERREDIALLAHSYLESFTHQLSRHGLQMREEVLTALESYRWPGNVRELVNVMERAVLLCRGAEIALDDLPEALTTTADRGAHRAFPSVPRVAPRDLIRRPLAVVRSEVVEAVEECYLRAMLESTGGRVGESARRAAIDPRSLYDKMRKYGLRKESFKR